MPNIEHRSDGYSTAKFGQRVQRKMLRFVKNRKSWTAERFAHDPIVTVDPRKLYLFYKAGRVVYQWESFLMNNKKVY